MARFAQGADLGAVVNKDAWPRTKNAYPKAIGSSLDTTQLVSDLSSTTSALSTTTNGIASSKTLLLTLSTAVSILVADGATPTQAHVTSMASAFGALDTTLTAVSTTLAMTDLAAATTDATALAAALNHDVVVSYNLSNVTTWSQLKRVVDVVLTACRGNGSLPNNS